MLILEKMVYGKHLEKAPGIIRHIYTLVFILISFAIFSGDNLTIFTKTLKGMFFIDTPLSFSSDSIYLMKSYALIFIVAAIGATPIIKNGFLKICNNKKTEKIISAFEPVFIALLLILSTASLVQNSFNPFLYFRF